jgi:hypothetical protein
MAKIMYRKSADRNTRRAVGDMEARRHMDEADVGGASGDHISTANINCGAGREIAELTPKEGSKLQA